MSEKFESNLVINFSQPSCHWPRIVENATKEIHFPQQKNANLSTESGFVMDLKSRGENVQVNVRENNIVGDNQTDFLKVFVRQSPVVTWLC